MRRPSVELTLLLLDGGTSRTIALKKVNEPRVLGRVCINCWPTESITAITYAAPPTYMRLPQDDGSPPTHPFDGLLTVFRGGRTSGKLDPSNGTKQLVITAADGPIALVWRCVVWPGSCSEPLSQETLF
ncbi:hypothetical protein GGI43DRAFT_44153 [Trichoderma evansii]